jgi:hypothetical protein
MQMDRFTVKAAEALRKAQQLAQQRSHPELTPVHLLAALVEPSGDNGGIVVPILEKAGGAVSQIRQGKLDPVIGRDEEIRRCMQVLSRRTKNNPVLIGEPGVGKTAIVEGLALRIVQRRRARGAEATSGDRARHGRADRRARSTAASSRSGSRRAARGDRERRAVILFIDELHTVVGAGAPRVRPSAATCSSRRWRAASCAASARPRSTSTASTSRRTRRSSGASSRSTSASRASRTRSRSCAGSRALRGAPRRAHPGRARWSRRRSCPPLHHRPVPARQGDRPDRRGGVAAAHRERQHADGARRAPPADHAARDRARGAEEGDRRGQRRQAARARSRSNWPS